MGKCLEKTKEFLTAIAGTSIDAVTNASTIKGAIKAYADDFGADTSKVETISDALNKMIELNSGNDNEDDSDSENNAEIGIL